MGHYIQYDSGNVLLYVLNFEYKSTIVEINVSANAFFYDGINRNWHVRHVVLNLTTVTLNAEIPSDV